MFASSYCSTTVRPLGLFSLPDFAMQKSWGYPPTPHPSTPFLWLRWSLDKSFMFSASNGCVSPRAENFRTVAPECFARSLWPDVSQPTPRKKKNQPRTAVYLSLVTLFKATCCFSLCLMPSVEMPQPPRPSRRIQPAVCVFLWVAHDLHCHSISLWVSSVALAIVGRGCTIFCFCQ